MHGLFHTPDSSTADVQRFIGDNAAVASTLTWSIWHKPVGKTWLHIICIGSGSGGGGGCGAAAGGAAGGGGGGASSGIQRFIYPMSAIPERLFVSVSSGGIGGTGGTSASGLAGGAGQFSYVAPFPNVATINLLAVSGAAVAGGGQPGTAAAGGGAGTAGSIPVLTAIGFSQWAFAQLLAGQAGTSGGAQTGAAGAALSITVGICITGGTGGGGKASADFAGGVINTVANSWMATMPPAAGAGGNYGSPGFQYTPYPFIFGGLGGGASNSVTGGNGGSCGTNAPGAGGGGGGAGVTVGGRGGDGGPGLVIMTSY